MANMLNELRNARPGRRVLLQAGGATGALLATGIPAYVLADPGQGSGEAAGGQNPFRGHAVTGNVRGASARVPGSERAAGFRGKLTVTGFYAQGSQVYAVAMADGELHDSAGNAVRTLQGAFSGPVSFGQAAGPAVDTGQAVTAQATTSTTTTATSSTIAIPTGCTVLNLVLGPLQLDLLGLVVTIPTPITINITAVPGGGLLGDLLCAIDNLLSGGLNLSTLLALLSNLNNLLAILSILGGLGL